MDVPLTELNQITNDAKIRPRGNNFLGVLCAFARDQILTSYNYVPCGASALRGLNS